MLYVLRMKCILSIGRILLRAIFFSSQNGPQQTKSQRSIHSTEENLSGMFQALLYQDEGVCSTEGPSESCDGDVSSDASSSTAGSEKSAMKKLKEQAFADLEDLLQRASQYKLESQESTLQIWQDIKDTPKKKRLAAIQEAISAVEQKLEPITALVKENQALKDEV